MTAVHQFVPALLPRDATGDHTFALRDACRAAGWRSDIYAEATHDELLGQSLPLDRYPSRARPDDVLVYQMGTASAVADMLLDRVEPLVIDYHNVTPPHFSEGWDPAAAARARAARRQLAVLAPRAAVGIADSVFNAAELDVLGCRRTEVVPILLDLDRRLGKVDPGERGRLAGDHGPGTVLLFVGRLSPSKAQHRLVQMLWLLRRWVDPDARLHLVGPSDDGPYARALADLARELDVAEAVRMGTDLSSSELAAWYADADVFVSLSEHEGFGIPLVEAMAAGLPVVAHAAGAVAHTVGTGGLLLPTSRPAPAAAAVARIRSDPTLAETLVAAGRARVVEFAPDRVAARFIDVLGSVAAGTVAA